MPISVILIVGGIVASPILWFAFSLLSIHCPPLAEFISKIFWQVLGDIPIFENTASILEAALSYKQFSGSLLLLTLLELLIRSIFDSFLMGFSLFATNSIFAKFNRKGLLIIPANTLVNTLGIVIGVLLSMGINVVPETIQSIFYFLFCIGLYLFGLGMMLGKPIRSHLTGTRSATIAKMLMKILVNANKAWCYVALVVCSMEGPRIVAQDFSNLETWLAFYGAIFLVYIILDSIIFFMSPEIRNSI